MTINDFISYIDKVMQQMVQEGVKYYFNDLGINDNKINFKAEEYCEENEEMYHMLKQLKECLKQNAYSYLNFQALNHLYASLKLTDEEKMIPLLYTLNAGLNFYASDSLRTWLLQEREKAKRNPKATKHPNLATKSDEELAKFTQEKREYALKLRKYVSLEGKILPVNPSESNVNEFTRIFIIPIPLAQLIIKACNRQYILENQAKKSSNAFIISSANKRKTSSELIQKTDNIKSVYHVFSKYIKLVGKKYEVIFSESIDETTKTEIIRLAKLLGLSEENQKNILINIEKHNSQIKQEELKEAAQIQREILNQKIQAIKVNYFTETMTEQYDNVNIFINDPKFIQDPSLNYIMTKLKEAKNDIDAVIISFLNEELNIIDFKELLEASFETLNNALNEAKFYAIISESFSRIRKED